MRTVMLYIAMSLDGYIADKHGGIAWLEDCVDAQVGTSFSEFIKDIDTILMGRTTYDQITTQLMPDAWPYDKQHTIVFTHEKKDNTSRCSFCAQPIEEVITTLRQQTGKDIWICGGAKLIHQALAAHQIDRIWITIMPTLLGEGIPLFQTRMAKDTLTLLHDQSYGNLIDLIYEVNRENIV